jgi:hypothetical protein
MMLGLRALRNPLLIGQMMGATISAESHDSLYGGVIPSRNHHAGYHRIGVDSVIGFLAGNSNRGVIFAPATEICCGAIRNFHNVR